MRSLRVGCVLVVVALAALLSPGSAGAHLRAGTVAVAFEASVSRPGASPAAPFAVGVYASDLALHLTVRPGHTVTVLGYLGEPFVRLSPAGLSVNAGSPTAAAAGLLGKGRQDEAGSGWRLQPGRDSVVWHDGRVSRLRPGARSGVWTVPVVVDGRRSEIAGHVRRLPAPALWPWLSLLAVFVAFAVAVGLAGTPRRLESSCRSLGVLAGAVAAVTAFGFALDSYASPGTWIISLDEVAFIAVCALALAFAPPRWRIAAGLGLGLLGLAVGLSKLPVFLRADVLSVVPGDVARLLAATAIGAGAAGSALGGLWFVRAEEAAGAEMSAPAPRAR